MVMTSPRLVRRRAIACARGTAVVGSERETQMGSALLALLRHACSIARGLALWFAPVLVDQVREEPEEQKQKS